MTMNYRPGDPCWTDLITPDLEGAKRFYGPLLGWTFGEPSEEFGGYTQAFKNGSPVAGLMPDTTMSAWTLYFNSDDIAKCEQTISSNGGTIITPPMAVGDLGSMMIAADPTGGVFGVWQAGSFAGAELVNEPGSMAWRDLRSKDPVASREFFTAVFAYRYEDGPAGGPFEYKTFAHPDGEMPLGRIGDMKGLPEELPSHWIVYLLVDDTSAALETVTTAGGSIISPMMPTPFGRQAVIADPYGAGFCIVDREGMQ